MNIFPASPIKGASNAGAGVEPVRSLSQIAATQLAQTSQPGVAGMSPAAAVPPSTTAALIEPPCLDDVYQWALANQSRMTGAQVSAMMDDLVKKLNTVKNTDGSSFIKSDADLTNAVGILMKKFASDGPPQSAFWNDLQNNLFACSSLTSDLIRDALYKEVKVYGEPE